MAVNFNCTVEQRKLLRYHIALIHSTITVQAYNLSSKLPVQTNQLLYLASRTSFSDAITSYRKIAVVLKLSYVTFADFFSSTAKT